MSIRRSSLICVAHLQVYERVANNRWWPNIGGLLYCKHLHPSALQRATISVELVLKENTLATQEHVG